MHSRSLTVINEMSQVLQETSINSAMVKMLRQNGTDVLQRMFPCSLSQNFTMLTLTTTLHNDASSMGSSKKLKISKGTIIFIVPNSLKVFHNNHL